MYNRYEIRVPFCIAVVVSYFRSKIHPAGDLACNVEHSKMWRLYVLHDILLPIKMKMFVYCGLKYKKALKSARTYRT